MKNFPKIVLEKIIVPALSEIGLYSDEAADMVLVTGAVESGYRHVRQIGGPALGLFQMEPRTHDDLWKSWLGATSRQHVLDGLQRITDRPGDSSELEVNPWYAAAMCRIHYMRDPKPLPAAGDRRGQAAYWKRVYNTPAGKGTEGDFMSRVMRVLT